MDLDYSRYSIPSSRPSCARCEQGSRRQSDEPVGWIRPPWKLPTLLLSSTADKPDGFDGSPDELDDVLGAWEAWLPAIREGLSTCDGIGRATRSKPDVVAQVEDPETVLFCLESFSRKLEISLPGPVPSTAWVAVEVKRDIDAQRDPGSRAIVTGASSGIGRAIARELARQGGKVVCMARREDRLQSLAKEIEMPRRYRVYGRRRRDRSRQCGKRGIEAAAVAFRRARHPGQQRRRRRDRAVRVEPIRERVRRIMEVNFFALVEMTRLALPLLKQGRRPIIVNVSSILGRRGVPHNSEYAASKFAVQGFSESIRAEFAAPAASTCSWSAPARPRPSSSTRCIESKGGPKWPEHKAVTADVVARATVRAIRRGSHEITPYLWGKVLCC